MSVRYVGFVLLLWFPGVLHAQRAAQTCRAPKLDGGYFVPEQETYAHETKLHYACDNGRKPIVEGWWGTSKCQNGEWSPKPQCIDEKACLPPEIPNAKYTVSLTGWHEAGDIIRIKCDKGYEPKNRNATAECTHGTWSTELVCEKSINSCGEPPKIPHAIIVHQEYQEVFAVDSEVQYECESGYTVKGGDSKKSIFCLSGNWTEVPTCKTRPGTGHGGSTAGGAGRGGTTSGGRGTHPVGGDRETRPGTGHGGSTAGGAGGEHTTSAGRGTQPGGGDRETRPGTGHGGSTAGGAGGEHTASAGRGTQPAGRETSSGTGHGGGTSAGTGTRPAGGGSSTTSGLENSNSGPLITRIQHCGRHPVVPNGDVVEVSQMSLKYQCGAFYTRDGPDTVVCYSDGTWSQLPICKDESCVLNPGQHFQNKIEISTDTGAVYVKEGERKNIPCIWQYYSSIVGCTNGKITFSRCCYIYDRRHCY